MMKKLIASAGFVCVGLLLMGFTPKTTVVMNETGQSILEVQKTLPLLQANSLASVTSPVRYTTDISEADINGRFVGMLLHMKWLMNENGGSARDQEIARLNAQVYSVMDDISEDNRDDDESSLPDSFVITDAGIVTSGTWQAAVIADAFLSEALTLSAGTTFSNNLITPNSILSTSQTDEYCLTYETTGSTFEWQACGAGGLTATDIDTSSKLSGILLDETGTGRSVFSISPAFSGTATFAALTASSTLTLTGTAANIALGANYLSGDGDDEGVYVDGSGNIGIGTTSPLAKLSVTNAGSGPSFLVEDSISPDNTPFVITANGQVGVGTLAPAANSALHVEQSVSNTSSSADAGRFHLLANPGANSTALYGAINAYADTQSGLSFNVNKLYGVYSAAYHAGTGIVTNGDGVWADFYNDSSGTVTTVSNLRATLGGNTGTITNLKILNLENIDNVGTITNTYGVYVGDITAGTQTNTPYSFYASDSNAKNYFAGNTGIGTTTPVQKLQVFGDIRVGTAGSNGCLEDFGGGVISGTCSSDERLKENIKPIAVEGRSYLEAMAALTPVSYNWNERAVKLYSKDGRMENLGLIAQDVEKQFPELVSINDSGYRQVDFRALPFYIMEALKELWAKVQGHDERLEALEKENEYLKERISNIENEFDIEAPPEPVVEEVVADESESQPSESPAEATETDVVEDTSLDTIQEEMVAEPEAEPTYVLVPVAQ